MDIELQACPICTSPCSLLDVVDFNKSCEEFRGAKLKLSGIPIYFAICDSCGFCFAPEIYSWSVNDFQSKIYNDEYILIDPDYIEARPRANASTLIAMFGKLSATLKHLDYGGGNGLLSRILVENGWNSISYDPFLDGDVNVERLGKFDLITAYEVFEHVPDVDKLMSDLQALISPNALVLFTTNLSDKVIDPKKRLTWWYASPRNGHISLFTRKSLTILADRNHMKFGSFSLGFHMFYSSIPYWAACVIRPAAPPKQVIMASED